MEENLRLFKPFIRGSFLIVLSIVVGVMAAKKYLSYVVPKYQSTTKLKLADINEGVSASNLFKDLDIFASANKITAEIEVIKSSVLLNKALDQLDFDLEVYRKGKLKSVELYQNTPFIITGNLSNPKLYNKKFNLHVFSKEQFELLIPGENQTLIEANFGEVISDTFGTLSISLNEEYIASKPDLKIIDYYEFEFLNRDKLLGKVKENLEVVSVDKDVAVIRIIFKSPIPEKAAKFVNTLSEAYIQDYIETKYKTAETTSSFLNKQIYSASQKLERIESNIENYRFKRGIVNNRQETETQLRKVAQLKIQQTNLKMNLQAIKALNNYIEEGQDNFLTLAPNFEAFNDLLSTEIIKKMKALQAEKKELLTIYTPKDEKVEVIDRKLDDLKEYLTESILNTKATLQIKYDNLTRDIDMHEQFFMSMPEREKIMTVLNREFELSQQNYITLNEKKIEAELAKAAKIAFHRVISPAKPSKNPVSPNRPIIIIVSALAGLFGSIFLIHLVHLFKAKVNDKYTIESNSAIPIAMVSPKLSGLQDIQNHFLVEAGNLEVKGLIKSGSSISFNSFRKSEGGVFNAFHMAKALAQQDRQVLILDIENALQCGESMDSKPKNILENLDIVSPEITEYKSCTKAKVDKMLTQFKNNYEIVIIINEKLGEQKSLLMMSLADVNFVVLDARLTPAKKIKQVNLLNKEYNLPNVHFVLNRHKYNPNIIKETFIALRKLFSFHKKQSWLKRVLPFAILTLLVTPLWFSFSDIQTWFSSDNEPLSKVSEHTIELRKNTQEVVTLDSLTEKKPAREQFHLIVSSFSNISNAEIFADSLIKKGYAPSILFNSKMNWHMVSIGAFDNSKKAKAEAKKESALLRSKVVVLSY